MPRISCVNVTKRFGNVLAIDRLSFDVEDGEYLCVLGSTGSGKTTLLRLIAGLLRPDKGTIYFDDKPVNNLGPHQRNAVYVPQQYALFPHLTVLQNVAFGPLAREKPRNEAMKSALEVLDLVRLAHRADALPNELSGGMQQRVALARGLATGAGLLLLDEPLGALDARLRLDLRHKLRELVKGSHFTAIHVTHDRDEAMSVADRIMILRAGRLQDHGTAHRVYDRPSVIFVANLIGGANFIEGVVEAVTEQDCTVRVRGGLKVRTPQSPYAQSESVILAIRKERIRVFSGKAQQLDNVFHGEVREVRFLGNSREYLVRLSNGDLIAARRFLEEAQPHFKVGEKVSVAFKREDVMTFAYPPHGLREELEAV